MPSNDPETATVDSKSSRSSDNNKAAPSPSASSTTVPISKSTSNTSLTSAGSTSSNSFGSRWYPNNHTKGKASHDFSTTPSLSNAILRPAISSIAAHNPFGIGNLTEDGREHRHGIHHSKVPSGDYEYESGKSGEEKQGSQAEVAKGEDVAAEEGEEVSLQHHKKERRRKRDLFKRAAGRSLSPFRYHHGEKRIGGRKLSLGGSGHESGRLNTRDSIDVERERGRERGGGGDGGATTDGESDGESVRSGITPRNNAFGGGGDSDDEDLSMHHDEHDQNSSAAADIRARNQERSRREQQQEGEAEEGGEEKKYHASAEDEMTEEERDEEEDDLIYFDDETLDNTLFNAGCIGLHDAWQKDDPQSSAREPEVYYGPNDYDAAWGGAGPTGHDEGDEGLRAPNVVIGEQYGHTLDEFEGDGLDVLGKEEDKPQSKNTRPMSTTETTISTSTPAVSPEAETGKGTYEQFKWAHQDEKKDPISPSQKLVASRPIFERNRCTISLVHGEYERWAKESKRPKRYIVASDGSEESSYAIEWTIGTVLRDGDEMLVVSVMETDTKLDSTDPHHEDRAARREHQMIRQSMCVVLARRATAVLQRTRLGVKVSCQALHARNSRHMFIDMIDFFEPTMCVVGSRGLGSLKGVLLGSFSHYCVQKSPVPVMVARKRLKLPPLPRGKGDVVSNVRARHMRLDQAMIEKDANVAEEDPEGKSKEEEAAAAEGEATKEGEGSGSENKRDESKGEGNGRAEAVDRVNASDELEKKAVEREKEDEEEDTTMTAREAGDVTGDEKQVGQGNALKEGEDIESKGGDFDTAKSEEELRGRSVSRTEEVQS